MARTVRSTGTSTVYRTAAVPGSSTGLSERKDERTEQDVSTRTYTGTMYLRHFDCPKGNVAAVLVGDLALGTVMPVLWGGVNTSNPEDPRLQRVRRGQ